MQLQEQILRTLTPSDGHVLTQTADVDDDLRSYASMIYLAPNDSPDDWREIPIEEAREAIRIRDEKRAAAVKMREIEQKRAELQRELEALTAQTEATLDNPDEDDSDA